MLTQVERQSLGPIGDSREGGATGQAGHMPETEPEMSRLERQPMLKNPSQV